MKTRWAAGAPGALVLSAVLLACGGGDGGEAGRAAETEPAGQAPSGAALTEEEMEKGIGPIRNVELGEIDAELAARGEERFRMLCYACHRLEERYVAPKLGDVLERRTPEYVMNMILNPMEMAQRHPEARALLAEFATQMPDQGLTEEEARAIVEYIRSEAASGEAGGADENGEPEG